MTNAIEWLEPWYRVEAPDICSALERQLHQEVSARHVLFGQPVRLIARRSDTDDALFVLPDGRVAEVHLTWSNRTEPDPRWPVTAVFGSLGEWARESMVPLHADRSRD